MPTYFELCVDPAKKVHTLRPLINFASIAGAIQTSEARMCNELLSCLRGQITIPASDVNTTDAQFTDLTMRERCELVDLKDHVSNIGQRRANGNGFTRAQALTARVSAGLCWTVSVDDLSPGTCPGLYQGCRKSLPGRYDIATQGVR